MSKAAAPSVYAAQAVPSGVRLKLDANELPGADPAWFSGVTPEAMARYPDGNALEQRIAERHGTTVDRIIVTAGGDEAIDRMTRVCGGPGRSVIAATPTFEMIPRYAAMVGSPYVEVPWGDTDPYPLAAIEAAAAEPSSGLLAIVTPNNPSGRAVDRADVERVTRAAPCPVMLDLAYAEFAGDDLSDLAIERPGVVAVRTFSKAWGLAGLRVGYAIGDAELIAKMRAAGGPYSVSVAARSVAAAALDADPGWMADRVARVRENRDLLTAACARVGLRTVPSQANFFLARTERNDALWAALLARGVLVRRWANRPSLGDALRISVPLEREQTQTLLDAIESSAKDLA